MKKLSILLTISFIAVSFFSNAQGNYKSAIGGRLGDPIIAFSYKHFITKAGAIEGYAGYGNAANTYYGLYDYGVHSFTIGAMYQHHFPIGNIEGFKWYIGGGALAQFYSYGSNYYYSDPVKLGVGVNAVGGVDYKFRNIPLNLSADVMPTVFVSGYYSEDYSGLNAFRALGGVAIRYTLR